METLTLKLERKIPVEDIKDLLDSASRGASYWCENQLGYTNVCNNLFKGIEVNVQDIEEDRKLTLNVKKIEKGLQVMALKFPADFGDFIDGNYDKNTGDVFLQCCLFGDVIYG